jgi:hypothetical protein
MKNLKILLIGIILISTLSCSEEIPKLTAPVQKTVYLCGDENYVPKYWVNYIPFELETNGRQGYATSMVMQGDDLYLTGILTNDDVLYPGIYSIVVWKNKNIIATISDKAATEPAISIINNDIYVVGNEFNSNRTKLIPKIWKNGIGTNLSNISSDKFAYASKIMIDNNSRYIVGYMRSENTKRNRATLWTNEVPFYLTDGTNDAEATSVAVNHNDVYVAGYEKNTFGANVIYNAKYWKNGVAVNLTEGKFVSVAMSISVIEDKIYVGGYEQNSEGTYIAKYWINGVSFNITNGTFNAWVDCTIESDKHAYSIGVNAGAATLWIDKDRRFTIHNGDFYSIFIK